MYRDPMNGHNIELSSWGLPLVSAFYIVRMHGQHDWVVPCLLSLSPRQPTAEPSSALPMH